MTIAPGRLDDDEDEDDPIPLGEDGSDEADLGPDARDLDLMDGSWERDYYSGRVRSRDWNTIAKGLALVVLAAILIPLLLGLLN